MGASKSILRLTFQYQNSGGAIAEQLDAHALLWICVGHGLIEIIHRGDGGAIDAPDDVAAHDAFVGGGAFRNDAGDDNTFDALGVQTLGQLGSEFLNGDSKVLSLRLAWIARRIGAPAPGKLPRSITQLDGDRASL